MTRTISQIAGEFGLARSADTDPFQKQEEAVRANVQRSLADSRSQQLESQAARGLGRSSFTEGLFARKEADVMGQVESQFAQTRLNEELQERQFERGIISEELGADRQSRLIGEQSQATIGQIQAEGEQKRLSLQDQAQYALEQLNIANEARQQDIVASGGQQRLTQEESFLQQQQLLQDKTQAEILQVNERYDNEIRLMNEKYDRLRTELPFELQQRAEYEKEILREELEVRREQNLIDATIGASLNYILGNLGSSQGISGLTNEYSEAFEFLGGVGEAFS